MTDEESIFWEAAKLQGTERDDYLGSVCGFDGDLRAGIEKLLAAHDQETSFLEKPAAADPDATLPMTSESLPSSARMVRPPHSDAPVSGEVVTPGFPAIPNCEVTGVLGRGGMGVVYRGRQADLNREVAIKMLQGDLASADASFGERFRLEGRAMAMLTHRNIVAVYDSGTTEVGEYYFVMEYVEGRNLQARLKDGPIDEKESISTAIDVCRALEAAHGRGIAHRDIKPGNILLSPEGEVKVTDFGLAKLLNEEAGGLEMTTTGAVMGTPRYWAPEQAEPNLPIDHRADIFAMGIVLYEMLCGTVPAQPYVSPSERSGCDPRLDEIVERAISPRPGDRFPTAREFRGALETVRSTLRLRTRVFMHFGAALVAAAGAVLLSKTLLIERFDLMMQDHWLRTQASVAMSEELVAVVVTNDCIKRFGGWPFDRSIHAKVLRRLGELGVRAAAFDIQFSEPSEVRGGDEALASAGREFGNVVYGAALEGYPPRAGALTGHWTASEAQLPLTSLIRNAAGIAHTKSDPDFDGVRRHSPLMVELEGNLVPNLGLAIAMLHLGIPGDGLVLAHDQWVITRPDGNEITVPIDHRGEVRIHFPDRVDRFTALTYSQLLDPATPNGPIDLTGCSVIIGFAAEGLVDTYPTPVDPLAPGVFCVASIANSVLVESFLTEAGGGWHSALILIISLLLAGASLFAQRRWGLGIAVALAFLILAGGGPLMTATGIVMRPILLLLGVILASVALLAVRSKTLQRGLA